MEYKMKLLERPFNEIKNGTKEVEFRLFDEKRKQIKINDIIEFSKLPELTEKIKVEVQDLYQYPTFKELQEHLGYADKKLENKLKGMYSIYTKEQEEKYGVLGIKIKKL